MRLSFTAHRDTIGDDALPAVSLKISHQHFELNLLIPLHDLDLLDHVQYTPHEQGAVRLGMSARADAWWSCDDGMVFIGIGDDDQTWDFGVHIPAKRLPDLRETIDKQLRDSRWG